jgi:hypothetical protein
MGIVLAELVAAKCGTYTMYVFKKLEDGEYIMCTKLPNWQTPDVNIGDIGFLQYQEVKAGEPFFNLGSQRTDIYKYSNIYFVNFILKPDINQNTIVL